MFMGSMFSKHRPAKLGRLAIGTDVMVDGY
jgi:hypothetical protein